MHDILKTDWLMSLRLVLVLVTVMSTFMLAFLVDTIQNDWLYFGTILIIFTTGCILINLIYYFCAFLDRKISKNEDENIEN